MRQPTHQAVPRDPFAATAPAPLIRLADPARQHRPAGLQTLPDYHQAELVKAGERRQIRDRECSVGHVEVFRMAGVRTSIIGRPRPSPPQRRAADSGQAHRPRTTPSFMKSHS